MSTRMAVVLAASTLVGAASLAVSGAELARPCGRSEAPLNRETRCLTAVQIPGKALLSFDISWVNADRSEFYLSDRSNAGIDVIDTQGNTFKRTIGGFVGVKPNAAAPGNNNISGPHRVPSHGRGAFARDGDKPPPGLRPRRPPPPPP